MEIIRNSPEPGMGLTVRLEEGETLGNFTGPVTISVPYASGNKESAEIDRLKAEGKITIPDYVPPPPPVPHIISDRQFYHALYRRGKITKDECMAAIKTGDVPSQMQAAIDAILDPVIREDVEILVTGALEYYRDHPAVARIGSALGYDDAGLDDLWTFAATL